VAARRARDRVAPARANTEREPDPDLRAVGRPAELGFALTLRGKRSVVVSATDTEPGKSIAKRAGLLTERRECLDRFACRTARDCQPGADRVAEPATHGITNRITDAAPDGHRDSLAGAISRAITGPISRSHAIKGGDGVEPAEAALEPDVRG
jgi:hypothetical protein